MAAPRRVAPLPPGWKATRRRILARDGHRCQSCGAPANHVDHIIPAHRHGTDDDTNLQALCRTCHDRKTGREARAVTVARQQATRRPAEQHPGLR